MERFDRTPSPHCRVCARDSVANSFLCPTCIKLRDRTQTGTTPEGRRKIDPDARLWAMSRQWRDGAFRCHFTDIALSTEGSGDPRYATWEHVEPGNEATVVLAADIVNRMKQNMNEAEFRAMVSALARRFEGAEFDENALPARRRPDAPSPNMST